MRPALEAFGIGTGLDTIKLRYASQNKDYTGKGGQPQVRYSRFLKRDIGTHSDVVPGINSRTILSILQSFGEGYTLPGRPQPCIFSQHDARSQGAKSNS